MSESHFQLQPLALQRTSPVVLVIIDGFGVGPDDPSSNTIAATPLPTLDGLQSVARAQNLYTTLKAHGTAVGLPSDEDMGNSEVGHNALGAGQIFAQGAKLVGEALASRRLFDADSFRALVNPVLDNNRAVHLFGLLSDGGVHSQFDHLRMLARGLARAGVAILRFHPLLDGRDVAPDSGLGYLADLEELIDELRNEHGIDARVASVAGRMYSVMDRYGSDWPVVRRGWRQIVYGHVEAEDITSDYPGYFHTAREAVECARAVYPTKLDQFNPVAVIVDEAGKPVGPVADGDLVINWNYRGDRAIQISNAFDQDDATFIAFERTHPVTGAPRPKCAYAGMLEYDTEAHIPLHPLVPPPAITDVLSQYTCAQGIHSYAVSETHKFGHVTYFWNGNRSGYFDRRLEKYEEITSEPSHMIETHPEMQMPQIASAVATALASGQYQFVRCNLPGPDMVGHTGNWDSVVRTLQCVDECIKIIDAAVANAGGVMVVCADHGNAERMRAGSAVITSHTTSPVPFFVVEHDVAWKEQYQCTEVTAGLGLSNVAATLLLLMGYQPPAIYHSSILVFNTDTSKR